MASLQISTFPKGKYPPKQKSKKKIREKSRRKRKLWGKISLGLWHLARGGHLPAYDVAPRPPNKIFVANRIWTTNNVIHFSSANTQTHMASE
jgi:hypothetical protein